MRAIHKLIIIFLAIVAIKIIFSLFIPTISGYSDEYFYSKMAQSIYYSFDLKVHEQVVGYYPPLYSVLISPSYALNDMRAVYIAIKIINAILSTLIIIPAWLLSKEFLKEKEALLVSVLVIAFPGNFSFSSYIMSENLYYTLFLFAIYAIYQIMNKPGYKWEIITGLLIGSCYLTKISGLILLPIAFLSLAYSAYKTQDYKTKLIKFITVIIFFLIIASLWLIRNSYQYGFSISGILNENLRAQTQTGYGFQISSLAIWFVIYAGYLLMSSGFIYTVLSASLFKRKEYSALIALVAVSVALVALMATNHSAHAKLINQLFSWIPGRIIGRYIDPIMPLLLITGAIGMYKNIKPKKWLMFISLIIAGTFAIATLFPLFPINNMSISWIGALSLLIQNAMGMTINTIIITAIVLVLLCISIMQVTKKIQGNKIVILTIILFMSFNVLNFAVNYYDTNKYWANSPQIQMGRYMNENYPEHSLFLFDEKYAALTIKTNQTGIYELSSAENKITSSIMGFWLNDDIVIGNASNPDNNADFIYTKQKLDLPLIKQIGDFRMYSSKAL